MKDKSPRMSVEAPPPPEPDVSPIPSWVGRHKLADDPCLLEILRDRLDLMIDSAESVWVPSRNVGYWRITYRLFEQTPLEVVSGSVHQPDEEDEINEIIEDIRCAAYSHSAIIELRMKINDQISDKIDAANRTVFGGSKN